MKTEKLNDGRVVISDINVGDRFKLKETGEIVVAVCIKDQSLWLVVNPENWISPMHDSCSKLGVIRFLNEAADIVNFSYITF